MLCTKNNTKIHLNTLAYIKLCKKSDGKNEQETA